MKSFQSIFGPLAYKLCPNGIVVLSSPAGKKLKYKGQPYTFKARIDPNNTCRLISNPQVRLGQNSLEQDLLNILPEEWSKHLHQFPIVAQRLKMQGKHMQRNLCFANLQSMIEKMKSLQNQMCIEIERLKTL